MPSEAHLKRLYAKYNRLYFDGELPTHTKVWWEPTSSAYADVILGDDGVWKLRVNPSISGWLSIYKWALLHEMAHIKLHPYQKHGRKFDAEMMRLAQMGAFKDVW